MKVHIYELNVFASHLASAALLAGQADCFKRLGQLENAQLAKENADIELNSATRCALKLGIEVDFTPKAEGGAQ